MLNRSFPKKGFPIQKKGPFAKEPCPCSIYDFFRNLVRDLVLYFRPHFRAPFTGNPLWMDLTILNALAYAPFII